MRERLVMAGLLVGAVGAFGTEVATHHDEGRHSRAQRMGRECVDAALTEVGVVDPDPDADRGHSRMKHKVRDLCTQEARRRTGKSV